MKPNKKSVFYFFHSVLSIIILPLLLLLVIFIPKKKNTYIWGCHPLINNKYWSNALKAAGYDSITLMREYYKINNRNDFDLYFEDLLPKFLRKRIFVQGLGPFVSFLYCIRHAKVLHMSYHGGPLGRTVLWRLEAFAYKFAQINTVIIPFGGDAYLYSTITNTTLRHVLNISYPLNAREEFKIRNKVQYWTRYGGVVLTASFMVDGIGRWDCPVHQPMVVDTASWKMKPRTSLANGKEGIVKILHAPNHRGFKGTEYVIDAIDQLKKEGWKVELVLLEGVSNEEVKKTMQEVDIMIDQIIVGYAMFAIEGMASGLPVVTNLEEEQYTRIFRRYSHLNECPMVSVEIENMKERLLVLIKHPELRHTLGKASEQYAQKYHSYALAQALFGRIYKRFEGEDVDLMNMFHPLLGDYGKSLPLVKHPLIENKFSQKYTN